MDKLVQLELNQIPLEADSFLVKALAMGRQYGRLPEYLGDALMAYLRAQSLAFAQRYRTGIAIGREGLERGLRQAFVCVELGLEERSGGDLNQAVDLLATGELETLRKHGWEEALARLTRMRTQSRAWSCCQEVLFLGEHQGQLKQWSQLVPETWTGRDPQGREIWIDPRRDYHLFQELESRLTFLRSLPRASLEGLLQAAPMGGDFAAVLRQMVLVLALDLERLTATPGEVVHFRQTCMPAGKMLPATRGKVLGLFAEHLDKNMPPGRKIAAITSALAAEIEILEHASLEELERLFILAESAQGLRP